MVLTVEDGAEADVLAQRLSVRMITDSGGTLPRMAHPSDLEARVARLEQQIAEVRELAAGAHEDAGTALTVQRQQARVVNAWGEQLNARLDEMDTRLTTRLDSLTTRLDSLETEMRTGFGTLTYGITQIKNLLNRALGTGDQ